MLLVGSLASCRDEGDDAHSVDILYNMVEYCGKTSQGTLFVLYAPDSDEAVNLLSTAPFNPGDLKEEDCLLIGYRPENGKPYESGKITLLASGAVSNDILLQGEPESLAGWDADPVFLHSLWRAGKKVAMRIDLVYDSQPRIFRLVVDETTLTNEYPDAYLVNIRKSDNENYMRQYYAAFDVSAIWQFPTCKGLNIHINNSNNKSLKLFRINKPMGY